MSKAAELWDWSLRFLKVRALPYGSFPLMAYLIQGCVEGWPSVLVWDFRLNQALQFSTTTLFVFLVFFVSNLVVRAIRGPDEDG